MENSDFKQEEIRALAETHIENPHFPIFIMMAAILKDISDLISL